MISYDIDAGDCLLPYSGVLQQTFTPSIPANLIQSDTLTSAISAVMYTSTLPKYILLASLEKSLRLDLVTKLGAFYITWGPRKVPTLPKKKPLPTLTPKSMPP